MHEVNSILIRAAKERILKITTNLALWPTIIPHVRCGRILDMCAGAEVVEMAAPRNGISNSSVSRRGADRNHLETPSSES